MRAAATSRSQAMAVLRVSSGNFLEMYDFMVYGYYASYIAKVFFPTGNDFASLMLSLGTFGAGFLMRPLGALVLGAYIDRHGRRAGLLLTLGLMAVGTLTIGLLPGYETLGVLAPVLIVLGRLLQGFSAGVELGGVSVYLAEIATPGNKGFYTAWQSGSQQVAVIVAASLGVLMSAVLPPESIALWGWRLPLLVGCMIVPLIFLLRRSLEETEAFKARTHHPSAAQILRSVADNWGIVLLGMLLVTMTTVSFYLITAYTPTFGSQALHLAGIDSLVVTLCVGITNLIWLPLAGALSDRIGRTPILVVCTVLTLLTAYPAMQWLVSAPSFDRLLAVELWLSFLYGSYNGAMIPFLTEIMPEEVRTTGFSLAYSLATATFGGFTPALCTWLIHATGNPAMPGVWLSFAALCGLAATVVMVRRGGRRPVGEIRAAS
ncbi:MULTISPECIES: MFS transporter [unclassified Inquilinus]|uniref:MFS transporter n=1 Tax=unclassified Inquilinus TaxID=2645927 RepID=UPI003F8E8D62